MAQYALAVARLYPKVVNSSTHALHMPTHIFIRLGLWKEAVRCQMIVYLYLTN